MKILKMVGNDAPIPDERLCLTGAELSETFEHVKLLLRLELGPSGLHLTGRLHFSFEEGESVSLELPDALPPETFQGMAVDLVSLLSASRPQSDLEDALEDALAAVTDVAITGDPDRPDAPLQVAVTIGNAYDETFECPLATFGDRLTLVDAEDDAGVGVG